jgi:Zn-dependent peptidase ImmA (M78 family)/transcriptional regulator with XRE-family HTH domain
MTDIALTLNPEVLQWARAERGYSVSDAAARLRKSAAQIEEWEKSGKPVSYSELKNIARVYKRQMSTFFLGEVPKKTKIPEDKRNLSINGSNLSAETLLAVRRTSRYLEVARELTTPAVLHERYAWLKDVSRSKSIEATADKVRELLDVTIDDQVHTSDSAAALRMWRDRIESNLGIFTFSLLMPDGELDGFSYVEDGIPYAIALNSRNTKNRNIFTLFHELAHIIEGHSGICLVSESDGRKDGPERRCDRFAAELLMPRSALKVPTDFETLKTYARELSVSTEAYARRLEAAELIPRDQSEEYLREIRRTPFKRPVTKEMKIPPVVMSRSRHGESFFNLIIDAHGGGRLSSSQAADILNLRPTAIDKL